MSSRRFSRPEWTENEIGALCKMVAGEKLTTGTMARLLSAQFHRPISRNAVCGKLKRLGLEAKAGKRLATEKPKPRPKRAPGARSVPARRPSFAPQFASAPLPRPRAPDPDPVLGPDGKPHRLETLPSKGCKWILGGLMADMKHAEYCGIERVGGGPYCEAHTARAWRRQINTEEQEEAA